MHKKLNIPIIWQLTILQLDTKKTLLKGVLLKRNPFIYSNHVSSLTNFKNVLNSYFIKVYKNRELFITVNGKNQKIKTDNNGGFSITFNFLIKDIPQIRTDKQQQLEISENKYPIFFPNKNSALNIISDIDDTIIVSHTASVFKRIKTLMLTSPHKRETITFTQKILEAFNKKNVSVFYVSKSESNLFGILSSFINHQKLPKGPLFLTSYLSFKKMLFKKKKADFKLENIRFILKNSEDKKFILLGDDTQKDMEIYAKIASEFPINIVKIYIHQTNSKIDITKQKLWKNLQETFPKAVYFNAKTTISHEIKNLKKLLSD